MEIDANKRALLKKFIKQKLAEIASAKVIVLTPYKINDDAVKTLLEKFPETDGKEYENRIDKSLIGGFIIIIGTKIIDASIKNKLNNLQKSLIN